jgi:type I restriction enzyme S subunit
MISYAQFSEQLLPVPEPPEQQKVADCLGSLDELIAAEGRKLEVLRQHKQGLMQQLFPQQGNAQPAVRFSQYRNAEVWNVTRLGAIADYENGKAYEKDIVDDGRFVVVNARFISTDGAVRKYTSATYCLAQTGDVLMVLSDLPSAKALARCFLVDADETYAVNQRVARLRPRWVDSRFLLYALDKHPWLMAFSDGINQTHLSKGAVLDCPVAVPRDDGEQKHLAECLRTVDSLVTAQEVKLAALTRHKHGLLQQLFPSPEEESR